MKTPRASTGILSSENDDFEFLKPAKDIKSRCITCIIVPGLMEIFITPNQLTINVKTAIYLYYIFSKV